MRPAISRRSRMWSTPRPPTRRRPRRCGTWRWASLDSGGPSARRRSRPPRKSRSRARVAAGNGRSRMDVRLSRHRTPSRRRREIFPAPFLLALALTAPLATPPPARAQAGADSVTITWTAPGDDGNVGTAQSYEVRVSQASITASNWSSAFVVPGAPDPLPAGTHQSMVVHGLTNGVTYYFAIKAKDEAGNLAPISNVVRWDWNADSPP